MLATSGSLTAAKAGAREAELGSHDCSLRAVHVEERGGVRPRTSRAADSDTQTLGDRSFGRIDEKTVVQYRIREESSQATHCVAAGVSIHEIPDQRKTLERSDG